MAVSGLLAVLVGFLGDWHWYADLFAHLRPQYCVWLGLALIGAWVLKYRAAGVLAALGLAINVAALLPYALPWPAQPADGRGEKVWTFVSMNLLYGNRDVARVSEYVRRIQPDIIVFEEVSSRWAQDLEVLSDLYPYRFTKPRKDGFGLAVFSKEKPLEIDVRLVGIRETDVAAFGRWESGGRQFSLAGVHPDKPDKDWKARNRQTYFDSIESWCREKARENEPVIVIGDFNATPWCSSMRALIRGTGLRNVNQGTIFGASWTVWQPHRMLIDHGLLSPQWRLIEREIGPDVGSDHRPLLIRAALIPTTNAVAAAFPGITNPATAGVPREVTPEAIPPL